MEQGHELNNTVVPVAPWRDGEGGLRVTGTMLEAVSASGRVHAKIRAPKRWEAELAEYKICDRFHDVLWCIGRPFSGRVRFVVDWKQNGYECAGELELPDHAAPTLFSWEIVVSNDLAIFAPDALPGYVFDVSFPKALHPEDDIVLRRRLVEELARFACDPAGKGRFRVSKNNQHEAVVNNYFDVRPRPENVPPIATCFPDLYTARGDGRTTY